MNKKNNYFAYNFVDFCTLKIDKPIVSVKQGSEIIRIDINFIEKKTGKSLRIIPYELWVSQSYVEDQLRINFSPKEKEYAEFSFGFIECRYKENRNILPVEYGAFVTNKNGIRLAKSRDELWTFFDEIAEKK